MSATTDTTRELPDDERDRVGGAASADTRSPAVADRPPDPPAAAPPGDEPGWQYLQVEAEWSSDLDEGVILPVSVVISQALEEHGRDGWEIAGVVAERRKRTYILRRLAS